MGFLHNIVSVTKQIWIIDPRCFTQLAHPSFLENCTNQIKFYNSASQYNSDNRIYIMEFTQQNSHK